MKKILLMVFSFALLLGCSSPDTDKSTNGVADHDQAAATNEAHDHDQAGTAAPTTALTNGVPDLNNGAKWAADKSTNDNVANLQSIVTRFKTNPAPEVQDYRAFNESFTEGLGKMVKECKMQGPDHDALHVWLEPLMEDNKEMKKMDSKEALASRLETLNERLNVYPKYFE